MIIIIKRYPDSSHPSDATAEFPLILRNILKIFVHIRKLGPYRIKVAKLTSQGLGWHLISVLAVVWVRFGTRIRNNVKGDVVGKYLQRRQLYAGTRPRVISKKNKTWRFYFIAVLYCCVCAWCRWGLEGDLLGICKG